MPRVSNSAADRAGEVWRAYMTHDLLPDDMPEDERRRLIDAFNAINKYRAMHADPLGRTWMGVRSMVRTATRVDNLRPGQRFKRLDRILGKLIRHPRMRLSQMEDIGGCRVIVPTLGQVAAVVARMRHNWADSRVIDYIANPKEDGYRGMHVIHRRSGRLIEVQVRTTGQHEWAETIEVFSPRLGYNLKDGAGPDDLRDYFRQAAARIARHEAGEGPDRVAEERFATLRQQVLHYFQRNP
ncbi:MAG: RelA/SpoT domain-containing protein [Sciscionella sp.]